MKMFVLLNFFFKLCFTSAKSVISMSGYQGIPLDGVVGIGVVPFLPCGCYLRPVFIRGVIRFFFLFCGLVIAWVVVVI